MVVGAARCAHPPPPPPAVAAKSTSLLPPGCEGNLAGSYAHAQNPSYRYAAQDDGGTLVLTVQKPQADAGASLTGTKVVLTRAGHAFSGFTLATVSGSAEHPCPLQLPTEAVSCLDGGVTLRAADRQWVGPDCEAPDNLPPAPLVEERLLRTGS